MAAVLKTADVLKRPWVRIPLSPPSSPLESGETPKIGEITQVKNSHA